MFSKISFTKSPSTFAAAIHSNAPKSTRRRPSAARFASKRRSSRICGKSVRARQMGPDVIVPKNVRNAVKRTRSVSASVSPRDTSTR